jgi:hypothetical protein
MTSCIPWLLRNCISCVPRCLLHALFVVSRVVNRTRMSCTERYGYTKRPIILKFLHSSILRYIIRNYMSTHKTVEWYRQCTVVISCYCLMFKPYGKQKSFRGRWHAHVPNIAHFKLLWWSDENIFSGKSFNAASLRVPSTWPPNCAYIILSHSEESSVWYFMNILLFDVQKLSNCFSTHVWYLAALIVWTAVFTYKTKKYLQNVRIKRYQFVNNNESSRNTDVKSEINKLSTIRHASFLKILCL